LIKLAGVRGRWLGRAVAIALLMVGCGSNGADSGLPVVKMELGKRSYELEVANTRETRERGLMHRESMPADHGMIFVFVDEQPRGFWMRSTRIPLDIIFMNGAGKVVSVHQMKPYDEHTTESKGPAKYAIELNQGEAEKAGVKEGDQLKLPDAAREAKE